MTIEIIDAGGLTHEQLQALQEELAELSGPVVGVPLKDAVAHAIEKKRDEGAVPGESHELEFTLIPVSTGVATGNDGATDLHTSAFPTGIKIKLRGRV